MPTSTLHAIIARTIRQDVQSMHGYAIQPSAGFIKLDMMENPFALPENLQAELGKRLGQLPLHRYPVACVAKVVEALSHFVELPGNAALMLGNGSDELIDLITLASMHPGGRILAPLPGFVMYEMSARIRQVPFTGVALKPDFTLDEGAMLDAIATHRPTVTWLAYPNNPTANLWDEAVVERIVAACAAHQGLVVFDEAYQPFSSRSWLPKLAAHPNTMVLRTLSKFGLAGVRMGYLCGAAPLVAEINKLRPPFNISALNAEATLFALEHAGEFARQAAVLREQRARLLAELPKIDGVTVFPSEANMILVRVPDSKAAFEGMKARGVLVKNIAGLHPLLANCLRLTVGSPDENTAMLAALAGALKG